MYENILQEYERDGFYIKKGLLEKSVIDMAVGSLKKNFDNQLKVLGVTRLPDDIYESMQLLHKIDINLYKKVLGGLWRKLDIYNLLHHERIQTFIKETLDWQDMMMPGGQVVHIQADCLKIPDGYFGFVPHQDFPSVQGSLDGIVVWVPLVDIDANRYPLEVVPGSHKIGIFPSIQNTNSSWEVKKECYNEDDFLPVVCEVGDVVIMSNFTLHRSSQKGDERLRLACSTRYDNTDEETFIQRGYPTAYNRTVSREQLFDFDKIRL